MPKSLCETNEVPFSAIQVSANRFQRTHNPVSGPLTLQGPDPWSVGISACCRDANSMTFCSMAGNHKLFVLMTSNEDLRHRLVINKILILSRPELQNTQVQTHRPSQKRGTNNVKNKRLNCPFVALMGFKATSVVFSDVLFVSVPSCSVGASVGAGDG